MNNDGGSGYTERQWQETRLAYEAYNRMAAYYGEGKLPEWGSLPARHKAMWAEAVQAGIQARIAGVSQAIAEALR